jgi:uncharacterized protein YraI
MQKSHAFAAALMAAIALPGLALAQTAATATAELNVRSGPGPNYPVVGVISANGSVDVTGCLQGSKWCSVAHNGAQGWVYSDYLTADMSGSPVVLTEKYADVGVPVTTFEPSGAEAGSAAGLTTGVAGGAVAGALIAGPIGAAVGAVAGGAAGAIAGGATGAVVDPPEPVRTYVTTQQAEPVYLEGEVVVGVGVPDTVQLQPVPDYQYQYAYINGQRVLVDPATRQIVYVVR